MKKILLLLIFLFNIFISKAQLSDLARLEYTYFPQRDSDNNFQRVRFSANLPLKLNDEGAYLVPGVEYRNVQFDFRDQPNFSTGGLTNFDSYQVTLGYTFKFSEYVRFAARAGTLIASNFENDKLIGEDILFSGAAFLIKDKTGKGEANKPWRLITGLSYSTKAGIPIPLPFVYYFKQFSPKWSYGIGVPKSNIKYEFNKKNRLQLLATLDGFFANIQNNRNIPVDNTSSRFSVADSISMTVAIAALGYERYFTDHLVFYLYSGFTFINDIRLRDQNEEDVFTINESNTFYFRGGLKFKI